jgi:UPF0176 protein
MEPQKVILFYAFTPLADPEAIKLWQHGLARELNLKGRILISKDGINGTLGGAMSDVKKYVSATKKYPGFRNIDFKWSMGTGDDFPRLKVQVKDELVDFHLDKAFTVNEKGIVNGGKHLKPYEVNKLVEERGEDVVFFDGRNAFEAKIGRFKNAIVTEANHTREFVEEIETGKYNHLKDRPIVTYCTGGIRCEILSTVLIDNGFTEVYQIDGGIVKYAQRYGDDGLWQGSLYTFDKRMTLDFSDHTPILGECEKCDGPTKEFYNCGKISCHSLILLCSDCATDSSNKTCTHEENVNDSEMVG